MNFNSVLEMAIGGVFPAIVVTIFLYLMIRYAMKRRLTISEICFIFYIAMLLYVTLFRYEIRQDELFELTNRNINLLPFVELLSIWRNDQGVFLYNVLGNILWFFPFGLLVKKLLQLPWWHITLWGMAFSCTIESLQYLLQLGTCDIDDVILNTIGALLGCLCYLIVKRMFHKTSHK